MHRPRRRRNRRHQTRRHRHPRQTPRLQPHPIQPDSRRTHEPRPPPQQRQPKQPPPSDLDSGYWRHEYNRVTTHFDRCEAIRRAALFLQRLLERDPNAPEGDLTDEHVNELILDNGAGWPPDDVARKYHRETRDVILLRIDAGKHPLTGKPWTPPELNLLARAAACEMRDHGMNSTDIGRALQRSANTVRTWTTRDRLAA
jgi:hypothetical protein